MVNKNEIRYAILHNRKTAGSAFRDIIETQMQRTPSLPVKCFDHYFTLPLFIKQQDYAKAIFFVRHPISRFVSGFYSRLREGRPRYYYPWNKAEKKAFHYFQTPNLLAEAISHPNFFMRRRAKLAMKSISHVKHTYLNFLGNAKFLEANFNRIAYIGHQENFEEDLNKIRFILNIDEDIQAPRDDVRSHRNPTHLDKNLSDKATNNLTDWYEDDFEIYEWCLMKRNQLITLINK